MQLIIGHKISDKLVLPINYHHILQSIIYKSLDNSFGYSSFLHNGGFSYRKRQYKLFTFSLLRGRYEISEGNIIFRDYVSFELRSPDAYLLHIVAKNIRNNGINYNGTVFTDVELSLNDETVEQDEVCIKMMSPVSVYSTDAESGKIHFYSPSEKEFSMLINDNFKRKYNAYCGVVPEGDITIIPLHVTDKDKYVTKYKEFYISGWWGKYYLSGERKYLDFLYQCGLGSKNSQGFGMFKIVK